jgi:hypothetical protein
MSQDAEMPIKPPAPIALSAAAERMRNHRERRRKGHRCVTIELRETEVDVLIRRGLLKPDARRDCHAICNALYCHFEATLKG